MDLDNFQSYYNVSKNHIKSQILCLTFPKYGTSLSILKN